MTCHWVRPREFFSRPGFFVALLVIAATANTAGYLLALWHEETPFDEAVHAFTTFAGMAAIGQAWVRRHGPASLSLKLLFATMVATGLVLGVLWEGFEYVVDMIGSTRDTVIDLIMDFIGAVVAAALVGWLSRGRSERRFDRRN